MEVDPRGDDYRREMRRREFGDAAVCLLCGEDDPVVFHHLAGVANDVDLEGPLCLNCHARAHEEMRHLGVDLRRQPKTVLERLLEVLRGLAAFFSLLARSTAEWAKLLARLIRALDDRHPEWRDLEEAW